MIFNRSLIAVDIGSSSIKMMELSGGSSRKLKSYGIELLPPGAIDDGVILENSAVKDTVAKLASSMRVKGRRAAVSLSGSGVLVRKVTVPVGRDVGLEEQIPFHAEQAFQLDPSGLYYDFVRLPSNDGNPDEIDILLVGARRETVEQYVVCVKEAGMKLGVIECNAFSLFNAFEQNYGSMEGLVALVNVGASHTQIALINNGVFLFNRDIPIGGATYTRRIMELLGKSYDESERRKIAFSISGTSESSEEILRVMGEINEQLVYELNGTLSYFLKTEAANSADTLKYVFMTGGASRTPGLDSAVASYLKAPVYPLNPFQRIEVSGNQFGASSLGHLATVSSVLGVATGLGLRRLQDKE